MMSVDRRSAAEEAFLLPTPAKILVIFLTICYDLFHDYQVENAIGIIFLTIGLSILTTAWWFSKRRLRVIGLLIVGFGAACPFLLQPPSHVQRQFPTFSKVNPPTLPTAGRINRDTIDATRDDGWFHDRNDPERIVLLRGVNFGASTKIPSSADATHIKPEDFYTKHRDVSFVSRPCPLAECDEHLARLASWGFNTLRLLITWEAVEHKGPGIYDQEYIQYLRALCRKALQHGISVFIDPHQDVWSRFTGGDGAPGWTLEKVGFNLSSALSETGATLTHQEFGDPLPRMSWSTNYGRLATATMFTLFFAGNDYAPNTKIDGIPAQEYLQGHYIRAMTEVAKALKDEKNVLGFDTMNEPSNGYVGVEDVRLPLFPVPLGHHMNAFDGMVLGAGIPRRIDLFHRPFVFNQTILMNPSGVSAWQAPHLDVWRSNGVWDISPDGTPMLLRPNYFKHKSSKGFLDEYMLPFFIRFGRSIREVASDMIIFGEPHIEPRNPVHHHAPIKDLRDYLGGPLAWVPHFYDGATLMTKSFHAWLAVDTENSMLVVGENPSKAVFERAAVGLHHSGSGLPVLVGETGVPMDMAGSFKNNDFSLQAHALNRLLGNMEKNFLSWTLWTYTPDNNNERGDLWNGEDLSLWSKDQVTDKDDLNSGGRALEAAIRPYPMKVAGLPLETEFDPFSPNRRFYLKVRLSVDSKTTKETILFIPKIQYPTGIKSQVGGKGSSTLKPLGSGSKDEQGYVWEHDLTNAGNADFVEQWISIETATG